MTTGERMKKRRLEQGIAAETVAEAIGISKATLYRYENGDIEKVPGSRLEKLASILRTTPAWLMGWTDNIETDLTENKPSLKSDFQLSQDEKELVQCYRDAVKNDQKAVELILNKYQKKKPPQCNEHQGG